MMRELKVEMLVGDQHRFDAAAQIPMMRELKVAMVTGPAGRGKTAAAQIPMMRELKACHATKWQPGCLKLQPKSL